MSAKLSKPVRLLLAALMTLAAGCGPPDEKSASREAAERIEHPHILVWLIDTLRADHVSLHGYHRKTSPNIDALARDSVVFENAYAPSSWTKPSTASLLTGRYPAAHGAVGYHGRLAGVQAVGDYLAAMGYESVAFSANPWVAPQWGFDSGFDRFNPSRRTLYGATSWQIAREVIKFLGEAGRTRPFFCYTHVLDPHDAYMPPEPFDTLWGNRLSPRATVGRGLDDPSDAIIEDLKKGYDGEIRFADEQFGRVMAHVKKKGLYDRMLIVVTSDHGEAFFEHGRGGHGHSLYETLVRVPLIIKFPHQAHAGKRISRRASLLDVLPTILGYLDVDTALDGANLVPLRGGSSSTDAMPDRVLFFQTDHVDNATEPAERRILTGVLAGRYKYVRSIKPDTSPQLFDLTSDPAEKKNVIDQHPQVASHLSALLDEHSRLAQPGIHFQFVNRQVKNSEPVALSAVLHTDGTFSSVSARACEKRDSVQQADDGQRLHIKFQGVNSRAEGSAGELRHLDWWIVDQDSVVFQIAPETASITVESLTVDNKDMPINVGAGESISTLPWSIDVNNPRLSSGPVTRRARLDRQFSNTVPSGVYLLRIPKSESDVGVQLGPDLKRRLESLGYVSGD